MTEKKHAARQKRIKKNIETLRDEIFKDIAEDDLWDRKTSQGFTTIPRTLPLMHRIMDDMSSGSPVSSVYFSLWSRVYDQSFIILDKPREVIYEAGFMGQRAESTWKAKMKKLVDLGFIKAEAGMSGPFHYILLMNPYKVVKRLYEENKVNAVHYRTLMERCNQIGADDLQ